MTESVTSGSVGGAAGQPPLLPGLIVSLTVESKRKKQGRDDPAFVLLRIFPQLRTMASEFGCLLLPAFSLQTPSLGTASL
jgi:hypothetical protein